MATTHIEAVLNKLIKLEQFQFLFNVEANVGAQVSTLTAELKDMSSHLKENRDGYCRSKPLDVFLGKGALKICSKFIGEHPCQSVTSIKFAASDVAVVVKNGNTRLVEQLIQTKWKCWENAQYLRWECLEVIGLPTSVKDDALEDNVCSFLI